jgi:phosphoribosylformylglycinamidine cyclo-ligase
VGMVIVVAKEDQAKTLSTLTEVGESPWVIGHIQQNNGSQDAVVMR